MTRLKIAQLVLVLTFSYVNLVSSDLLNISDIYNSKLPIVEYAENGMTKIKIYPTNNQPIRKVYDGEKLVWSALLGEKCRMITITKFKYSGEVIVDIEIDFPASTPQKIYCKRKDEYFEIDQKTYQEKILSLSTIQKEDNTKIFHPKTEYYPIPPIPSTRQRNKKGFSKHPKGKNKRRKYVTPSNEDTETSSETEEILKFRYNERPTHSREHTGHTTSSLSDTISNSSGLQVEVPLERRIKKPQRRQANISTQVYQEELEPEIFELEISSDSDMDVDEPTHSHIQSDAITQTESQTDAPTKESSTQTDIQQTQDIETQTENTNGSSLPLKKRPYKPD
uniref:TashHN n=1 Tax=Theileria annulata TaxID=5874 RepID=D3XPF3_THEAN|nr:TashHN [Theileria annulata]